MLIGKNNSFLMSVCLCGYPRFRLEEGLLVVVLKFSWLSFPCYFLLNLNTAFYDIFCYPFVDQL